MQPRMNLCMYHQSRLLWTDPVACRQQNYDTVQGVIKNSCPCNHSFNSTIVIFWCHSSSKNLVSCHLFFFFFTTLVLEGVQFQATLQFPPADITLHSNKLRSKLGQIAVSLTWLTCGCCTCSGADHLFNPSALFLHTSPGC